MLYIFEIYTTVAFLSNIIYWTGEMLLEQKHIENKSESDSL
jgi:hypothetical protein